MSGRKNVLAVYQIITNGDMTTTLTSAVTNISYLDNIPIQLVFTGTPVGAFQIQGSLTYQQDNQGNVTNPGTWDAITLNPAAVASGSSGSILLDLNQLSFPYIRVVYIPASGSGSLNAYIGGKQI